LAPHTDDDDPVQDICRSGRFETTKLLRLGHDHRHALSTDRHWLRCRRAAGRPDTPPTGAVPISAPKTAAGAPMRCLAAPLGPATASAATRPATRTRPRRQPGRDHDDPAKPPKRSAARQTHQ